MFWQTYTGHSLSILELDYGKWKSGRLRLRSRHDLVVLRMSGLPRCLHLALPLIHERLILFVPDDPALAAVCKSDFAVDVRQKYDCHAELSLEQRREMMILATRQVALSVSLFLTENLSKLRCGAGN